MATKNPKYEVISKYSNCGATITNVVKTFATRDAAERYADRYNDRAARNCGGIAIVKEIQ